ncbi:MAG: isopeptide-forming domain-containing fimbrial protein [Clostridium sp.]
MPTDLSLLSLTIDKTSNVSLLLGGTTMFILRIKNTSQTIRLYNLNIYLTLPDGMSVSSSIIPITSQTSFTDGSTKSSWINLKDLAPMELEYDFNITVKGNTTFKNGATIPFGNIFSGIVVRCEMDTMPRGDADYDNVKQLAQTNMTFKSVRFYNTITTSGKVLKGAGTSRFTNNFTKSYTASCRLFNNAITTSTVNITLLLQDGIRYIGNITVSGTDGQSLLYPQISSVIINGNKYVQLLWANITLSKNSDTTLNFIYAVWNRYNENTGDIINHGTQLNISSNMSSVDDSVDSSVNFLAMDLIISTSVNNQNIDIGDIVQFSYTYEVGGYYDMQNLNVDYILPDGILYLSSSSTPFYAEDNPKAKGYELKFFFLTASMNSSNVVTISGKVNSTYKYKYDIYSNLMPVVAFDNFKAITSIVGTKVENLVVVSDSASTSCNIKVPVIAKVFLKGYYSDGTAKTINTLAPGDLAQYKLTYDASALKAMQNSIYLDDFFPLSADPIDNINYIITGYIPTSSPQNISPHGAEFNYGNVLGGTLSTITFKVPIAFLGTPSQNINLLKVKGLNSDGVSYSNRSQVTMNIGSPNILLTKSVSGPNKSAIKCGEVYNYTVKITNTNTLGTETDAFSFVLADELSTWVTINPTSIKVTGTGSFGTPTYTAASIQLPINKLSPGNSITLTYSVTIRNFMAPGISITTNASNTNPYSQIYNQALVNYQYSNLNKTALATISSQNISVNKVSNSGIFKVGSSIVYTITITVPLGTVVQDLYVKDTLSNGNQIYSNTAFRNGVPITPSISSNIITFPNEGYIDATNSANVISYVIYCKIIKGTKSSGVITTTQNNTAQCLFRQQTGSSTWTTVSKTLGVTINHPNLRMSLSARNTDINGSYSSSNNVLVNSTLDFRLDFTNNSNITLVNGTIQIPISGNFKFNSVTLANGCTAGYNSASGKIIITIGSLQSLVSGYVIFNVSCLSNLRAGTTINTQGIALSYYNDISPAIIYSGEQSNICITVLPTNISLLPDPSDRVDDATSYRITTPGSTMTILNYLTNTGGGYDDYQLSIKAVGILYTLYIDNDKIGDIPENTPFNADLDILKNMAPNSVRVIKIVSMIPASTQLGCRYNFIVTGKSKTSPYLEKTVLNIDPT